ncbi:hypothetical protein [Actinospongicola halichondriae]|uniref:hypothetical protein n=1 Tax=Actinospongicola halichondriae TaxID=3236844 RepID=UPI003D58E48F
MERSTFRRASATLFAAAVLFAACGDDDTTTDATSETTMAMDHDSDHSHDEGVEVGDLDDVPTLAITAEPDSIKGVNVQLETSGFTFAPEHASTEHVDGEGHAHIYVDGEKVGRVYEHAYYLGDVEAGEHEITVELNANSHSPLLVDGEKIAQTVTVDVPEPAEGHSHGDDGFEAADPVPTVMIEATADPMAGQNIHVVTTDFTFTPELIGQMETESGQGHAHLYVDGQKVTRLYGEWFHLAQELDPGEHEVRVVLSANDHRDYVSGGDTIEASTTITIEGDEVVPDDASVIEVTVDGGEVAGGGRTKVALGDPVTIRVTSDVADHIHLHGYDVMVDVAAGETVDLTFDATIPGVFEVELEESGLQLLELEIS